MAPLSGKAWQLSIQAKHEADQRYGLDSGGPAEERYWREQDMERWYPRSLHRHPAEIEAEDYEDFAA